jgi:hypothetical protein
MDLEKQAEGESSVRKATLVTAIVSIFALGGASAASAFEGGGRQPSEAPTIVSGQRNVGQLNNHKSETNYNGEIEVAFWRLPPVSTRDVVTIDWHSAPFTHEPGNFPICMILAQGIDDFSWGSVFGRREYCDSNGPSYELPGSGAAHTEITVQETNTSSSYLEFYASAGSTNPAYYETYPYDFTLGTILHYLAAAIQPTTSVSPSGVIRATVNLADGRPAPDGLPFNLSATWTGGGVASYSATTSGGAVSFQLALPETAYGKTVTFVASHAADGTYQAIETPKLSVKVDMPKPPPPSGCALAERRALVLARQFKRLKKHARYAYGPSKRRLNRRARQVNRRLQAARAEVRALCVT